MHFRYVNTLQCFERLDKRNVDHERRGLYKFQNAAKSNIFNKIEKRKKEIVETNYINLLDTFKKRLLLYIDRHIIVVNKPCGLLSQGDLSETNDLLTLVKKYIQREKNIADGKAYLGLVHRLDRNVSGCMVFARNSKSARRLCKQLALKTKNSGEEGRRGILEINERKGKIATSTPIFEKVYYCIVHGSIDPNTKCLISARLFGKNKKIDKNVPNQSKFNKTYLQNLKYVQFDKNGTVTHEYRKVTNFIDNSINRSNDWKEATLSFKSLACFKHEIKCEGTRETELKCRKQEVQTLLRIELTTGRKHQIRAMLEGIGHPIVGDIKYGSKTKFRDNSIALHAGLIGFVYPSFQAPIFVSEILSNIERHDSRTNLLDYKNPECFFDASVCRVEKTNSFMETKEKTISVQKFSNATKKPKENIFLSFGCLPPSSWSKRYGEDTLVSIKSDISSSIAKMNKKEK